MDNDAINPLYDVPLQEEYSTAATSSSSYGEYASGLDTQPSMPDMDIPEDGSSPRLRRQWALLQVPPLCWYVTLSHKGKLMTGVICLLGFVLFME